jgi:TRAP-type C4-dicarboxylate transport system permease small subunit
MNEERFDAKKAKRMVKIIAPIIALLAIIAFIVLPVKFWNTTLRKEAESKDRQVERIVDINLFDWLK